jgi:hypothetical protein
MRRALSRIARAIIRDGVVVVMTPAAMIVMPMVVMIVISMVEMAVVGIRVSVKNKARKDARRGPVGHADDGRQRKHDHHRPDQGGAVSARLFQSRQHFAFLPAARVPTPLESMGWQRQPRVLSR